MIIVGINIGNPSPTRPLGSSRLGRCERRPSPSGESPPPDLPSPEGPVGSPRGPQGRQRLGPFSAARHPGRLIGATAPCRPFGGGGGAPAPEPLRPDPVAPGADLLRAVVGAPTTAAAMWWRRPWEHVPRSCSKTRPPTTGSVTNGDGGAARGGGFFLRGGGRSA
jgi:hypothetical protein